MNEKKFYYKHEADKNLKRPVTRSSCVFYFQVGEKENTTLHFLNYWKVKRGISELDLRVTLRDLEGNLISKTPIELCAQGAMNIDVRNLLNNEKNFNVSKGSVELEIFSKENMFISYPGVIVRYVGDNWHSSTHTSQRILSADSGDIDFDTIRVAEEGNQTIQKEAHLEPFLFVHNGPNSFTDTNAKIEVFGENGKQISATIPKLEWAPYETKMLFLKDYISYRDTLEGGIGSYRFCFSASGVFPRLIAGFKNINTGALSIDHTNFAAKSGPVLEDQFDIKMEDNFVNLAFNIPNNTEKNWDCYADIYPTYPSGDYSIQLQNNLKFNKEVSLPKSEEGITTRLNLKESDFSKLNFKGESKLPRRFHTGVHYKINDGDPGFLIDGPIPFESSSQKTRWSPIFSEENTENYLLVSNRVLGDETPQEITYTAKVYNSFSEDPIDFSFSVAPEESKIIKFEDHKEVSNYLKNEPGWIYMQTETASKCVFHYVSVHNGNSIACDHAF